jgi:hypothetical protein
LITSLLLDPPTAVRARINSSGILFVPNFNQLDEVSKSINSVDNNALYSNLFDETQSLTFTPPNQSGPGSLLFANNSIANIQTANTTAFAINANTNFTIECWVNAYWASNYGGSQGIFQLLTSDVVSYYGYTVYLSSGNIFASTDTTGGGGSFGNINTIVNSWNHIAFVRYNGYLNVYLNGFKYFGTSYPDTTSVSSAKMLIGYYSPQPYNYSFPGYIADFRFVIGTALYTSNFTPPTSPPNNIANTALLLTMNNASNALVDSSINNLTLTNISGSGANVSFSTSSPFTFTPATVPVAQRKTADGKLLVSGYFDETTLQ